MRVQALKARVENGYLVMRERTDLPEGTVLDLVPANDGDELGVEERTALHASLERALDDEDAGRFVDSEKFLAEVAAGT